MINYCLSIINVVLHVSSEGNHIIHEEVPNSNNSYSEQFGQVEIDFHFIIKQE